MSYLGENIPKLGFGLMRLPKNGDVIDLEQTKAMVDRFLAAGFTYFDTAYGYEGSEAATRAALVDRYPREAYQLATKLPAWAGARTAEEAKQMFYTSLERTGAGYFDFYLLHNCGETRTAPFDAFGIWDFVMELKEQGLVKHVGFSFHDQAPVLDDLLTRHPEMEFVQMQVNYADWENPAVQARACCEVARKHGKPVVIMEPVKGGLLANLPESAERILKEADPSASPASWAIRFAASLDNVITVLSGMSNLEQMEDNIAVMSPLKPLDEGEKAVLDRVRQALEAMPTIPCTACHYCMKGCPQGINIPGIFVAMNRYLMYGDVANARGGYAWETREGGLGSKCIGCKACEAVCPQHISIVEELKKTVELLEETK